MYFSFLKTLIFGVVFLLCIKEYVSSKMELENTFAKDNGFIGPASTELLGNAQKRKKDKTRKRFLSKQEISKSSVQTFNGETRTVAKFRMEKELPHPNRTVRTDLFINDL